MKRITVEKPWGKFEQFTQNENTTVKVLFLNKGGSISLQDHGHRSEFWHVLSGNPIITIGEESKQATPGDEFNVNEKQPHRIEAPEDNVRVLEISFGDFDENDIERLEDKYGRA